MWCVCVCMRDAGFQSLGCALSRPHTPIMPKRPRSFDPTKAKCCKLVEQRGKTRSSTFQALSFLRIFQETKHMKYNAPANSVLQTKSITPSLDLDLAFGAVASNVDLARTHLLSTPSPSPLPSPLLLFLLLLGSKRHHRNRKVRAQMRRWG